MASFSVKSPPPFDANEDDFTKWKRKFKMWQTITEVRKNKHGTLLTLNLDRDTQDSIMELVKEEDMIKETGADEVLDKLEGMFGKDESIIAFEVYEDFETYKRPPEMSIAVYCTEFQKRLSKVKSSGTQLNDHVLAFRLLKSANISERDEQLVKATITKMDYESMIKQLKKVVKSNTSSGVSQPDISEAAAGVTIKAEQDDGLFETLYGGGYNRGNRYGQTGSRPDWNQKEHANSYREYFFEDTDSDANQGTLFYEVGTVPMNVDEDEYSNTVDLDKEVYSETLKLGSGETSNAAILDSGAPKTICGKIWLKEYITNLSNEDKQRVTYRSSSNSYTFGHESRCRARKQVTIPAVIGERSVKIKADVVEADLPLLLSLVSLKEAKAELNFEDNSIKILGQTLNLHITQSGHYVLSLRRNQVMVNKERNQVMDNRERNPVTPHINIEEGDIDHYNFKETYLFKRDTGQASQTLLHNESGVSLSCDTDTTQDDMPTVACKTQHLTHSLSCQNYSQEVSDTSVKKMMQDSVVRRHAKQTKNRESGRNERWKKRKKKEKYVKRDTMENVQRCNENHKECCRCRWKMRKKKEKIVRYKENIKECCRKSLKREAILSTDYRYLLGGNKLWRWTLKTKGRYK